jgi:hypothetical protein
MSNPSVRTVGIAGFTALLHVTSVLALVRQYEYPMTEAFLPLLAVSVGAFGYAFVPTLVSVHTRLVTPVLGLLASVVAVVVATATSPAPVWNTLGSQSVVTGAPHVWNYVNTWGILLGLIFVAGVTEFAIRHGYQLASGRLQAVPSLPFSRRMLTVTVILVAGFLGTATALTTSLAGSMVGLLVVGSFAAVATVIPRSPPVSGAGRADCVVCRVRATGRSGRDVRDTRQRRPSALTGSVRHPLRRRLVSRVAAPVTVPRMERRPVRCRTEFDLNSSSVDIRTYHPASAGRRHVFPMIASSEDIQQRIDRLEEIADTASCTYVKI